MTEPTPTPTFSKQEAEALVAHAASAPLRDLNHAMAVKSLLEKFLRWHSGLPSVPVMK